MSELAKSDYIPCEQIDFSNPAPKPRRKQTKQTSVCIMPNDGATWQKAVVSYCDGIPCYHPRLAVSTDGNLWDYRKGISVTPVLSNKGHYKVGNFFVHRLVACTFLECDLRGYHVHHSNFVKTDNRLDNLVITTPAGHRKLHRLYESRQEQHKVYYQAHKEEYQAYGKAYGKAYYQAHKEERQAYKRIYYQAHKEEYQAHNKAYYQAHKEERQAYGKAYGKAYYARKKAERQQADNSAN